MSAQALDRLVALVRRDLGADDVRVVGAGEGPLASGTVLRCDLPQERVLVVEFREAPSDVDARMRRLEMLADSFRSLLLDPRTQPSRPPPAQSLHEELRALAERAEAHDALVIDARSPIVWGAADAERASRVAADDRPTAEVVQLNDRRRGAEPAEDVEPLRDSSTIPSAEPRPPVIAEAGDKAIAAVRALSVIPQLHKGGHLHHAVRADDFGYVARSFAAIYVLIVVYEAPFDELRAERAIQHALPQIERLVMALPPLDPTPVTGAAAIRRGRRR